jgi:hypothetical protein
MTNDRSSSRNGARLSNAGVETSLDGTDTKQISLIFLAMIELYSIFFWPGLQLICLHMLLQPGHKVSID